MVASISLTKRIWAKIFGLVFAIGLSTTAGWLINTHWKIQNLIDELGTPTPHHQFIPSQNIESFPIDLGYVRFDVPEGIPIPPQYLGDLKIVRFISNEKSSVLDVYPPMSTYSPEYQEVINSFSSNTDQPMTSWFELMKSSFTAKSFSI